jgi:acetyl-CoA decarbonylase/synthase complex subunit beta
LDPHRGEYTGVNESTAQRTDGRVKRVYLHGLFDFPHTACSCFKNVAFYIREVDGIGLMHKGFEGTAPNGMTWTELANRVAGRQCPDGAVTFSNRYLHSRKFLAGEGGYSRVVWMTEALKKFAGRAIPERYRRSIATENEVTTIKELEEFLHERRQQSC